MLVAKDVFYEIEAGAERCLGSRRGVDGSFFFVTKDTQVERVAASSCSGGSQIAGKQQPSSRVGPRPHGPGLAQPIVGLLDKLNLHLIWPGLNLA